MTSTPNLMELKECLQEAGMYEENMNEDEMRSYYNAIKSSENTAKEEDEQRNNESTDVFEMDAIAQDDGKMLVDEQEKSSKEIDDVDEENERILDPLDCSPMEHRLTIIYHTPRYNLPPHIDPKLKKLSAEARAKIISAFHYGLLQKFYNLHKQSEILAPWPSPIYLGEPSKKWLDHKSNSSMYDVCPSEQENEYTQEVYTSRSGRQTKRKVYAEEIDSDSEKKRTKKNDVEKDYKPVSKRMGATKPSNQEIMKRSKLFKDSPKSCRTESMFEQMVASEKKRQQDEEKIETFKKSLSNAEEDDDIIALSHSPSIVDDDIFEEVKELPVIRRRIPPPLHGRRGIGTKKTAAVSFSEIDKLKASENSPKQTLQRSAKTDVKSPHTSTSSDNKEKNAKAMTKCPICSEFFHKDEVEAHASNCGLSIDTPLPFEPPPDKTSKKLRCEICGKQMPMNTAYEIHVAECMRKERMK